MKTFSLCSVIDCLPHKCVTPNVASSWKLLHFTAQQVMRFMFPAAAAALCLEINGWGEKKK